MAQPKQKSPQDLYLYLMVLGLIQLQETLYFTWLHCLYKQDCRKEEMDTKHMTGSACHVQPGGICTIPGSQATSLSYPW